MPLNDAGMQLLADTLQDTLLFAQLHSSPAGVSGTDNIAVAGRQPANWATPVDGDFGLLSQIAFTGGTPGGDVHSVTLWDEETGGVVYGEYPLDGDGTFNLLGQYQVTVLDWEGTTA